MSESTLEAHSKPTIHGFHANYFLVFIALCACTVISVATDLITFESRILLAIVVLSIAVAKALFVMAYFMHLKFEGRWKFVLLAPTLILALGLPLALLPDIGMHYYWLTEPTQEEAGQPQGVLDVE